MKQCNLENLEQFHSIFRCFRSHGGLGYFFRGQANKDWQLLPKAGREEYFLPDNKDLYRFNDWEEQAIAYMELPNNICEKMAIAQHHGLATRLLDWTQNPLVASYFAVSSLEHSDGAIYIFEPPEHFVTPEFSLEKIKKYKGIIGYFPRAISPRVISQKGMFTIHCPANQEIEIISSRFDKNDCNLTKIVIPYGLKNEMLKMLDDYCINELALFPDLDGLSRYNNWGTIEMVKRSLRRSKV